MDLLRLLKKKLCEEILRHDSVKLMNSLTESYKCNELFSRLTVSSNPQEAGHYSDFASVEG